jgi:hypothetical protein
LAQNSFASPTAHALSSQTLQELSHKKLTQAPDIVDSVSKFSSLEKINFGVRPLNMLVDVVKILEFLKQIGHFSDFCIPFCLEKLFGLGKRPSDSFQLSVLRFDSRFRLRDLGLKLLLDIAHITKGHLEDAVQSDRKRVAQDLRLVLFQIRTHKF